MNLKLVKINEKSKKYLHSEHLLVKISLFCIEKIRKEIHALKE